MPEVRFGSRAADRSLARFTLRLRIASGCTKTLFQFRDLRAKAGTDKTEAAGDIRAAQLQLGHASLAMTQHYVRERKGDKVEPTRASGTRTPDRRIMIPSQVT